MQYAEVAVNAPGGHRHTFSYSVPDALTVSEGSAVWVPFGARRLQGVVVTLSHEPPVVDTRDITGVIGPRPLVSRERIQLGLWISSYYLAPIFTAVALMLPPGFESQRAVRPRLTGFLRVVPDSELMSSGVSRLEHSRALRQLDLLNYLQQAKDSVPLAEIRRLFPGSRALIRALVHKGLVLEETVESRRNPLSGREFPLEFPLVFTDDQQAAWRVIQSSMTGKVSDRAKTFLLHGVTGSGKTEIYLQALAETVRLGKRGICLVPEISLTPQVVERFMGRFPGRVALLHSRLSLGEQHDMWDAINAGEFDVVIGPRSAVFAPQPDLGLIVVDEEHEWAYKQSDKMPRYHARDVAEKLASLTGATLILGSATPSVETYFKAKRSEYDLVELKERITIQGASPLPEVHVVNMTEELKAGNRSIFSRRLRERLGNCLAGSEQAILFINRRGQSTLVQCMNCGHVPGCKRCSAALTYHAATRQLICHHCRRVYKPLTVCPVCASKDIRYFGIGTETVVDECRRLFPAARIIRFDTDAVANAREYEQVVSGFRKHEADVLVGTQILAKGLHFPDVTLVAAVNADVGLNLPDFRAAERTFDLLCQVSGRAGRGAFAGEAIIQTFKPGYYAIKYAAHHDYAGFYGTEIEYRRRFGYPPFSDMVRLVYSHSNLEKCAIEADRVAALIREKIRERGVPPARLIGPASARIARLRGRYQTQIVVLGNELQALLSEINLPRGWVLDVDPVGMI